VEIRSKKRVKCNVTRLQGAWLQRTAGEGTVGKKCREKSKVLVCYKRGDQEVTVSASLASIKNFSGALLSFLVRNCVNGCKRQGVQGTKGLVKPSSSRPFRTKGGWCS